MALIRPMLPEEDRYVRKIYTLCHPKWSSRPKRWFFACPTLVALERDEVIGSTSFFLSYPPPSLLPDGGDRFIMWGHGVYVHPDHRGRGIGLQLCEARFRTARTLGIEFFIGMTWPSNKPMIHIFEQQGCALNPQRVSHAYPENFGDDQLGLMYTKGL